MYREEPPLAGRLLVSFVIATSLFILVFLGAYSVSYANYQGISAGNNLIGAYLDDMEDILGNNSCSNELLYDASEKLDIVGSRLSLLETRFGKNDPRVLEQKKQYTELEFKHFSIVKRLNEECGADLFPLFFFYSNIEELEEESERMSFILSAFKRNSPERIMVYSFDYNMNYELVDGLREEHNVTFAPRVLIVDEGDVLYVRNIDDLEVYL